LQGRKLIWDAIDDIKHGRASVILVYAFDRLSRDVTDRAVIKYEVEKKYGGQLLSATEAKDDGPLGPVVETMLAAVAQMERANIVRRMERGKRDRAARGQLSAAPNPKYGYRWVDDTPGQRTIYAMDETTAAIVRRIFDWAVEGKPTRWIARQLSQEGIPTPSTVAANNAHTGRRIIGKFWSPEAVRRILNDDTYTGQGAAYRWERTKRHEKDKTTGIMRARVRIQLRDGSDTMRVVLPSTTWPAIIDPATFAAVQQRLGKDGANRQNAGRNLKHAESYLLRGGHVFCGVCGSAMHGAMRTDGAFIYRCPRRPTTVSHPDEACAGRNQSIRVAILDRAAWDAAKFAIAHYEDIHAALSARLFGREESPNLGRQIDDMDALLQEKRTHRDRLIKRVALTDNEDLAASVMKDAEALSVEIRGLEEKRAKAVESFTDVAYWNQKLQRTISRIQQLEGENLDSLSYEERRHTLYLMGLRVSVYPTDHEYTQKNGQRWDFHTDLDGAAEGSIVTQTSPDC
jgi:DNA invertase Pin-like site-specific DNA recombinase